MFSFFTADPELVGGDTLTCGVCRKEFALADIVKFIQHKVLTCNKENYNADKKKVAENGQNESDLSASSEAASSTATSATTTLTTSMSSNTSDTTSATLATASSTLTRRHSISTTTVPPEVKTNLIEDQTTKLVKIEPEKRKVDCVDAESNTINSGKPNKTLTQVNPT